MVATDRHAIGVACGVEGAHQAGHAGVAYVEDVQTRCIVGHIGVIATDGHTARVAGGVVCTGQRGVGGVADVDDLQAFGKICHIGVVAADGHTCGRVGGVVNALLHGQDWVGQVDDLQARAAVCHVSKAAAHGHRVGLATGVVVADKARRAGVADVDDLQPCCAIGHVGMAAADHHPGGRPGGVQSALERWPLAGVDAELPIGVAPRSVPGREQDGAAEGAAVVGGNGVEVDVGVGIGKQHLCLGGADRAHGRPCGTAIGAEVGGEQAVDGGDGDTSRVAIGIAVVRYAAAANQASNQSGPGSAAVGGCADILVDTRQHGGLAVVQHRAGTGARCGQGAEVVGAGDSGCDAIGHTHTNAGCSFIGSCKRSSSKRCIHRSHRTRELNVRGASIRIGHIAQHTVGGGERDGEAARVVGDDEVFQRGLNAG